VGLEKRERREREMEGEMREPWEGGEEDGHRHFEAWLRRWFLALIYSASKLAKL